MITESEEINKGVDRFVLLATYTVLIEVLSIIGLVLYMLAFIDILLFLLVVVVTNVIQYGYYMKNNNKAEKFIRETTDSNIAIHRNMRPLDLSQISDLEQHNRSSLMIVKLLYLAGFATPWIFFLVGMIVGQFDLVA
jgi:hypothetical protein